MSLRPYLSVVVATRDDKHGGNPEARLKAALSVYKKQTEKLKFPIEFIIVDWNSPEKSAGIFPKVRSWALNSDFLKIRVMKISEKIHRGLDDAKIPFYQMIAKNVGIRRAKGKFILASNIDIFLDDNLIKFLSEKKLSSKRMYRSDRVDLDYEILKRLPKISTSSLPEKMLTRKHIRTRSILKKDLLIFLRNQNFEIPSLSSRISAGKWLKEKVRIWKKQLGIFGSPGFQLHTNGCGDFTLLSRSAWHALRGYPEFRVFSFHIDSIFCHQAHESGYFEAVFPDPLVHYHIDHSDGWTPETNEKLLKRLRKNKIPFIENQLEILVDACRHSKKPIFNTVDWGLFGHFVPEYSI